jgi:hypothetical protein
MFRPRLLTLGLAGAIGIPVLMNSHGEVLDWLRGAVTPSEKTAWEQPADSPAAVGLAAPPSSLGQPPGAAPPPPLSGLPVQHLAEVLRFDVSPEWVLSRWARVSTAAGGAALQGFRVPLVTGTAADDLAGSLTYYFDARSQVQRLTFVGTTGDPSKLVAVAASRFGFVPYVSSDPAVQLYQIRWNGQPTSELRIRPSQVVRTDAPYQRYEIDLEINHPDGKLSSREANGRR